MSAMPPGATEFTRRSELSRSAKSSREQMQQLHVLGRHDLLDHFVGECKQLVRHGEPKRPGGLGVDDQLEL
jgi:hypothetical protein